MTRACPGRDYREEQPDEFEHTLSIADPAAVQGLPPHIACSIAWLGSSLRVASTHPAGVHTTVGSRPATPGAQLRDANRVLARWSPWFPGQYRPGYSRRDPPCRDPARHPGRSATGVPFLRFKIKQSHTKPWFFVREVARHSPSLATSEMSEPRRACEEAIEVIRQAASSVRLTGHWRRSRRSAPTAVASHGHPPACFSRWASWAARAAASCSASTSSGMMVSAANETLLSAADCADHPVSPGP